MTSTRARSSLARPCWRGRNQTHSLRLAGWALWKLGFELIGSAVALVGAAVGGILILVWLMSSDFMERWS